MTEAFEKVLKQSMGLDAESIGVRAIQRAVEQRLKACRLTNAADYLERVQSSEDELQELIEAIVVPETWFLRDPESFVTLTKLITEEWWPKHPGEMLRVLSLPCSTGEEPYSIAMALMDAGMAPGQFLVDAVDISHRALSIAAAAVYGRNSFRGKDQAFREKYFANEGGQHRLKDEVRERVVFKHGNMLEEGFLPGREMYDVVFCRNVLIYFDDPTQERAVRTLDRLLAAKGWMFTGPAEAPLLVRHGFVSMRYSLAFAFRKCAPEDQSRKETAHKAGWMPATAKNPFALPPVTAKRPAGAVRHEPVHKAKEHGATAKAKPAANPAAALDEAAALADQGKLKEATKVCEAQIRQHGPSARAFYILGLVQDAAGEKRQAEQYYRKALYLEPGHHETLVHLALLLERSGDAAGARVLHSRAQRMKEKLKPAGKP